MKSLARTLALLLATSVVRVDAAVVPWLYDVEVPVASQAERQRAARTGLRELLVRITGMAELPANPEIQAALREPEKYYGRFEFSMRSRPGRSQVSGDVDSDAPEQMVVALHYEPATVLALLRRAALPVWGADRPTVLVWVAVEQDGARRIVSASSGDELLGSVRSRARERGLVVSLPVMDLADHATTPTTVWGRFWAAIESASARYNPDLIVVGRVVQRADGVWVSDWEARSAGVASLSHGRAAAAPQAVAAGVDTVADALAERFAVGGRLDAITVTIRGASTIAAYASVLDYLRSREYIERMEVKAVARDVLTLHLHSRSSVAQLEELLSMGSPLAAVPVPDGQPTGSLEFAWAGDG
ncbi:MAG: DUF2066 domain-containing protein [Gammaproteobacteria bacterium]|nr:DUF2066 domain-containing protein [Gammaproteobacteria bacterium]